MLWNSNESSWRSTHGATVALEGALEHERLRHLFETSRSETSAFEGQAAKKPLDRSQRVSEAKSQPGHGAVAGLPLPLALPLPSPCRPNGCPGPPRRATVPRKGKTHLWQNVRMRFDGVGGCS